MNNLNLTTKTQGWIMTGIGALIALAAFMPWVTVAVFSVNGIAGDGKISLAVGLILAALGVALALNPAKFKHKIVSIAGGVLSLVVVGVAVMDFASLASAMTSDADNEFEKAIMSSASPGIGLILTTILGVAALALSVVGFLKERSTQIQDVTVTA